MAYENLCMYCFEDRGGKSICPHCGRDNRAAVPQIQMLPGAQVYHSRFLVGRALGQDASGIVYAAFDTKRESKLRIREYLPRDCAERLNDGTVVPVAGKEDQFEAGMRKLRATVEDVDDPRRRHFYFEENGTAYIAQRKNAAAAAAAPAGEERPGVSRRLLVIIGVAVAVVVAAAIGLISLFNGAMDTPQDISQAPTVNPNEVWIPIETPTPTPYVAPTFAALVDPDMSWIEFNYDGITSAPTLKPGSADTSGSAGNLNWGGAATQAPTPRATPASTSTSKYKLVSTKSDRNEILALQRKLAQLGWLSDEQITGRYDSATVQAVKDLQTYVNKNFSVSLSVDGLAGPKTQLWIYEADVSKPAPTPTPMVTPKAEEAIQSGSDSGKVRAVQQALITLGLMPKGSADGKYGAATVSAVKKFQQRVNQLQGYQVLDVTGTVDALTKSFLDYYAEEWARLRKATATPAPTTTPLPQTTEIDETDHTTIDSKSPVESIQRIQRMLVSMGLMSEGSADGKYGKATSSAVMQFQQWVNTLRGEKTLNITGIVDPLTRQYLEYCYDRDIRPYATLEPQATATPTPEPDDEPVDDEPGESGEIAVGPDSEPESISFVQRMLASVGLLSESGVTGSYDDATAQAVRAFQQWVNSQRGEGTVSVTGQVDDMTRQYLEYCFDRDITVTSATDAPTEAPTEAPTDAPTQAPTATPTPEPDDEPIDDNPGESGEIAIGPDSEPESISFVQQMLASVGLLSESGVTGSYDDATAQAVRAFQQWVNSQRGEGTVGVTGQLDDATRQYLEYCFDRDITVSAPTQAATAAPAETPDDEPIDEPIDEPTEAPGAEPVTALNVTVGGVSAGGDVVYVSEDSFTVSWSADGDVDSYALRLEDAAGNEKASRAGVTDTKFTMNTSAMNPGEVYTLTLTATPADGGDPVTRTVRFVLLESEVSAPGISIAGVSAGSSAIPVDEDSFQISWNADGDVAGYFVSITDAQGDTIGELSNTSQTSMTLRSADLTPGVAYTLRVGALPVNGGRDDIQWSTATFLRPAQLTEAPTAEPTAVPATPTPKPSVGKPVINIDGTAYQKDGLTYITGNSIIVSWTADGSVDSYYVYIENAAGKRVTLGRTTETSRSVPTSQLPAGRYTVHVGVMPQGGGADDAVWSSYEFAIPAAEATQQAATQKPATTPAGEETPTGDEGDDTGWDGDDPDVGGDADDLEEATAAPAVNAAQPTATQAATLTATPFTSLTPDPEADLPAALERQQEDEDWE